MAGPTSFFDMGHRALSAQLVRMNTAASNLANAGSVAGSEAEAYRPMRTVFAEELNNATGMSSVRVGGVVREDVAPIRRHDPGHPLADENGDVCRIPDSERAPAAARIVLNSAIETSGQKKNCSVPILGIGRRFSSLTPLAPLCGDKGGRPLIAVPMRAWRCWNEPCRGLLPGSVWRPLLVSARFKTGSWTDPALFSHDSPKETRVCSAVLTFRTVSLSI